MVLLRGVAVLTLPLYSFILDDSTNSEISITFIAMAVSAIMDLGVSHGILAKEPNERIKSRHAFVVLLFANWWLLPVYIVGYLELESCLFVIVNTILLNSIIVDLGRRNFSGLFEVLLPVSYTHLTLPTNREV